VKATHRRVTGRSRPGPASPAALLAPGAGVLAGRCGLWFGWGQPGRIQPAADTTRRRRISPPNRASQAVIRTRQHGPG